MTEEKKTVQEQVRMIRWRMAHEKSRFFEGFWTIPRWLKVLTVTLFIVGQVAALIGYHYDSNKNPLILFVGGAAAAAIFLGFVLLFYSYINRDAKRRGMNSTLWTLLAIFVPYLIGVIIYFLMREPLPFTCPECDATVNARFNFCPNCKYNLRPSCPQCKREVRLEDKYCPYCAQELSASKPLPPPQTPGEAQGGSL